ncbi:MAG: hypothetical protein SVT52_01205 [Planctomycetota bacterium]|nr:hypothetical protein [Planctomycetota bacterium]
MSFPSGRDAYRPVSQEVHNVNFSPVKPTEQVRRFVQNLTGEERLLVVLKRELYEGDWDEMASDLKARLAGGPYIFKLAHRIADDLARIERLRQFEQQSGTDLNDYVELDE